MEDRMHMIEARLDVIEKKLTKMEDIDQMVSEIYIKLVGSELFPEGVIKELSDLKTEVTSLKKFKLRVIYTVAGFMTLGGFLGYLANLLYNYLSKK